MYMPASKYNSNLFPEQAEKPHTNSATDIERMYAKIAHVSLFHAKW